MPCEGNACHPCMLYCIIFGIDIYEKLYFLDFRLQWHVTEVSFAPSIEPPCMEGSQIFTGLGQTS